MKEHFCPAEKSMITYQGKCNWCGERETLAQTQEPVAWRAPRWSNLQGEYGYRDFNDPVIDISTGKPSLHNEPLYTTPPQRTWVGLDEVEIVGCTCECIDVGEFNMSCAIDFARAIEAKLKGLNR